MKKKIFIGIGIVIVILAGLAAIKFLQIHKMMATPWPAEVETISSAIAHEEKWKDSLSAVGSIDPQNGVTLAAEVPGTVAQITMPDGATVAKGDLLIKLDASSEEAQLRSAEAQTELARLNVERTRSLRTNNTVSASELDQAEATYKQSAANADVIRAAIEKKTIRAPFAGRLGIWQVNVGASVDARRALVSLQSPTPVYADFSLPQQNLAQLETGMVVQVSCDAYPDKKFEGALTAINPDLNAMTRSVPLRATFDNADGLLRPGMFVRTEIILPEEKSVLAIPATAILSAPYGDSVFVILTAAQAGITNMPSTNLVAQQKIIRTGRAHGDFISVEAGLTNGDKVATSGIFKLRNGVSVQENNEGSPKPSLNPTPPNS